MHSKYLVVIVLNYLHIVYLDFELRSLDFSTSFELLLLDVERSLERLFFLECLLVLWWRRGDLLRDLDRPIVSQYIIINRNAVNK